MWTPDCEQQLAACREELLRIERLATRTAYADVLHYLTLDDQEWLGTYLRNKLKELEI